MHKTIKSYGGVGDTNDIDFAIQRYGEPEAIIPAPISVYESGEHKGLDKINPNVTRLYYGNDRFVDIFHVKPIYYLHQTGLWRPLSEVTTHYGNKRVDFSVGWDKEVDLRYFKWLMHRAELIGGHVNIPIESPYLNKKIIRVSDAVGMHRDTATIHFTTTDFYPDANPETTSFDGFCSLDQIVNWATARAATDSDGADDTGTIIYNMSGRTAGNGFMHFYRGFVLFDTSALTSGATISAATFSTYGFSDGIGGDPLNTYALVASTPASNTGLVVGDYDQLGTTKFCDTNISLDHTTGGYNDFVLNATGLAAISKTSITKFGTREEHDRANSDSGSNGYNGDCAYRSADRTGTSEDPKLSVTYIAPGGLPPMIKLRQAVNRASTY